MANPPAVLDNRGQVVPAARIQQIREAGRAGRGGMRANFGGPGGAIYPYDAASFSSPEMAEWWTQARSPDSEISPWRDVITGRARAMYRNDGWAKGAIGRILDSTIGASYRLVMKPDYRSLSIYCKELDSTWAQEYRRVGEALWRNFADDIGHWSDLHRRLTISQQFRLALGHKLVDGDSTIVSHWRPDRQGLGAARWATCFEGVDPDRLCNPYQRVDTRYLRNGVELDEDQAPIAYHFRKAHAFDWYNAVESMEWERVEREDPDGWRRVFHDYDPDRYGQSRGVSVFAPVLGRMKMLSRYYGVELSAATVASHFGLYVQSPFDLEMVRQALDSDDDVEAGFGWYQDMRSDFHKERDLSINGGVKIASLAPGEEIKTVSATRPNSGFSPFTHEMLRSVGAAMGLSGEQVTNDTSDSSWSSMRGGIVEAEKTFVRRCQEFEINTATPLFATWLEEAFDSPELRSVMPRGAPPFMALRTAYSRCRWLGAARGWVDPVAERQGVVLGLDAALSTMEEECARQGMDWEENIEQRAIERKMMIDRGLPPPVWMGAEVTATDAAQKPKVQEA